MKRRLRQLKAPAARTGLAILAGAHVLAFIAAVFGLRWVFAGAIVAILGVEAVAPALASRAKINVSRVQQAITLAWFACDALAAVLAATAHVYHLAGLIGLVAAVMVLDLVRVAVALLARWITRARELPYPTLNIDLSALRIPDPPPARLVQRGGRLPLLISVPLALGVVADALSGGRWAAIVGGSIGAVAGLAMVGTLAWYALGIRHLADHARAGRLIVEAVTRLRPQVLLHFSGVADATYQMNVWLDTLAAIDMRPLILVREKVHLPQILPTGLPVVCIPGTSDVMNLKLDDLKIVLYPSNVGKNLNTLWHPEHEHVFIFHGDSDKLASANPVSRMYDEVWVAGRAARLRYRRPGVGVRDEEIVEVGRPQLRGIEPARPDRAMFTVLYAPTWEGWSEDMLVASQAVLGVRLIERLLAVRPEIRVIYKPHPMAGTRNPAIARAHGRIVAAIHAANERRAAQPDWVAAAAATAEQRAAAARELDRTRKRISALGARAGTDLTTRARDTGRIDAAAHAERDRLIGSQHELHFAAAGHWRHHVIAPKAAVPSLYACFNEADLLVSDISSVATDFLASGKPYVMTNVGGADPVAFREANTAAHGAYLLGPDLAELDEILAAVRTPGPDLMAARRAETRHFLLGPDEPGPLARFNDALNDLARRRDAEFAAPAPVSPAGRIASARQPTEDDLAR